MSGCSLFVPRRKQNGSDRSQGSFSPPTTMTAPAPFLPPRFNSQAEGHLRLRRRTTNLCGRLASDCHVAYDCIPIPWVAHTSRCFCRDVCALSYGPAPDTPDTSAREGSAKYTRIVGTNSISRLESIKPEKNELKTNPKRTAKTAEICAVETQNMLNRRTGRDVVLAEEGNQPPLTPPYPRRGIQAPPSSAVDGLAGADVAFERLRCAEGAGWSDCAASPDVSLRDIADPTPQGSAPAESGSADN